ncbi:MAG: hypothetical protein QM628_17580 [Propionicimonas sp.]
MAALLARLVKELLRIVTRLDQRVTYYGHGSDAAAMVTRVGSGPGTSLVSRVTRTSRG